ncbi:hypothetical protein OH77DRAFT_531824 [Trametes cingulata]|nr:hypothetical protein OH77DRAFT_531824 [Trametes cingulata]
MERNGAEPYSSPSAMTNKHMGSRVLGSVVCRPPPASDSALLRRAPSPLPPFSFLRLPHSSRTPAPSRTMSDPLSHSVDASLSSASLASSHTYACTSPYVRRTRMASNSDES